MAKIPTLEDFRSKIDVIDNKIINLLKSRMAIVARVAEFKKSNNYKFFIRSAREADMIKDLQKNGCLFNIMLSFKLNCFLFDCMIFLLC
jgi:chorismate mutase